MKCNLLELQELAEQVGRLCRGGECFELIGDLGTGKTTFTKALAMGLEVNEDVQSPSFTISREYDARDGLRLAHYDFYRLTESGVTGNELAESVSQDGTITVIEWAETVHDVLPVQHIKIWLSYLPSDDNEREVKIDLPQKYEYLRCWR